MVSAEPSGKQNRRIKICVLENLQKLCFRYNQKTVWKFLLSKSELEVNLQNSHGQTALHTAARFNIPDAASDLLQRPEVDTNIGSVLGSSPSMVAVKYASKETLQVCNLQPGNLCQRP